MNFTAAATVIATLLIAILALSIAPPVLVVSYTPREKVEALDYIALVNALAYAQGGGDFTDFTGFLRGEVGAAVTVLELNLSKTEKSATVVFRHGWGHGWANVTVEAYLRLVVLGVTTRYVGGCNLTLYRVRIEADRPVAVRFTAPAEPLGGGEYLVAYPFRVSDNRGLWVEP